MGKLTKDEEKMVSIHVQIYPSHLKSILELMKQEGIPNKSVFMRQVIYNYLKSKGKKV